MKLKKGQVIYIDNRRYVVVNMIEFCEDTWVWQEYEIVDEYKSHKWLSVEEDENNKLEYYIYRNFHGNVDTNEIENTINNKVYELYEKGTATVKDYFGNADVDKYETCEYFDYISKDEKSIVSVEKWDGEIEKSIGERVDITRIKVTEEIEKVQSGTKNKENIFAFLIFLFCSLPIIASVFSGIFTNNKSMKKYMEKNSGKYTYVTSVTNNANNKKARVYEASFNTIDETVKDIIDGVPEGITTTLEDDPYTTSDGIGLETKKEYAYIYEEDFKVYVQVSSKEYVNDSGTMYHSRHHSHYYSTYRNRRSSSQYSTYLYSARQRSINSRTTSGGGTSSGK